MELDNRTSDTVLSRAADPADLNLDRTSSSDASSHASFARPSEEGKIKSSVGSQVPERGPIVPIERHFPVKTFLSLPFPFVRRKDLVARRKHSFELLLRVHLQPPLPPAPFLARPRALCKEQNGSSVFYKKKAARNVVVSCEREPLRRSFPRLA